MKKSMKKADIVKIISVLTAAAVFVFMLIAKNSADFIENVYSPYISKTILGVLSFFTARIPFSLTEALIIMLFLAAVVWLTIRIINAVKVVKNRKNIWIFILRMLGDIALTAAICYTFFTLSWGMNYYRHPMDILLKKSGIEVDLPNGITLNEIETATAVIINRLNKQADQIKYDSKGLSINPLTFNQTHDEVRRCYLKATEDFTFLNPVIKQPSVKKAFFSTQMCYMGICGIFIPFTAESLVGAKYPDFVIPDAIAHETAHLNRIAREDEANFIAFVILQYSDNEYMQYSANLNLLIYLMNSLYRTDTEAFRRQNSKLDERIIDERKAYSEYLSQFEGKTEEIVTRVNDTYLKNNGQAGVISYSQVVRLAVGYIINNTEETAQ